MTGNGGSADAAENGIIAEDAKLDSADGTGMNAFVMDLRKHLVRRYLFKLQRDFEAEHEGGPGDSNEAAVFEQAPAPPTPAGMPFLKRTHRRELNCCLSEGRASIPIGPPCTIEVFLYLPLLRN